MKNKLATLVGALALSAAASAQTWIWYPGDYEIWLGNRMNNRRTERGAFFPPFWKTDSHYVVVEFSKKLDLAEPEEIFIAAEGKYNVKLDGKLQFGMPSTLKLPAGKHSLNIKVWNQSTPPTIYVKGKTVNTDKTWKVTYEDKEWIDESGKASDTSATVYMDAGCWNFDGATQLPSKFSLARKPMKAVSSTPRKEGVLYDFGKETFGYITLKEVKGKGTIHIYYGESPEEALDTEYCETLDKLLAEPGQITDLAIRNTRKLYDEYTLDNSKAFRYVYVTCDPGVTIQDVSMQYEYLPEEYRGSFKCNDEELNRIWEVGAYTMHLTTREFFIDGIKRDRWVWSGDAIQSYLMNYYLFFDNETVKRTIWLLRGKDPVTSHSNTIMDYTFYWFLSIYDYYMYSGDKDFVTQLYPRMQSMMDYVLGRTNANGMVEGMTGDWVFVDWADGYLDKKGELSFEQVLFCKGATSFWEKYNPEETGTRHLAMYGRPYGKSLCHAWGASPIYLLGKYYLGVKPTKPGYEEYSVTPCLGGLKWMEGTVPTPYGNIHIYMDKKEIRIKSDGGKGVLNIPTRKGMKAMTIEPGEEQVFKY